MSAERVWRLQWRGCHLRGRWLLIAVCFVSFIFMAIRLRQGPLPSNDPIFGHIAEHMLQGRLPNADSHANYVGGLSSLSAGTLQLFGGHLLAPRLVLFAFFMVWVPCFWYVARRITSPIGASVISLLAVIWSVPLYPSPLPSWYNLYFATFGTAALLRYLDSRRARWLFLAGVMGGVSFLARTSGLYFWLPRASSSFSTSKASKTQSGTGNELSTTRCCR